MRATLERAAAPPPSAWAAILPSSATADSLRMLTTRALRGFADGAVSLILVSYLTAIGFDALHISAIVTGTLLGSATLTLIVGWVGHRLSRRRVLLCACLLMFATGVGFFATTAFWVLILVAVVGTLNPSANDVSVFLPFEQAALSETVKTPDLTALFAWVNLSGGFAGALGALASGLPATVAQLSPMSVKDAERSAFLMYAAIAVLLFALYRRLSPAVDGRQAKAAAAPLARSRRIVFQLAALFSLDAFGGGFVVDSLLALWLFRRFGLSPQAVGAVFFAAGLLAGFSQLASSWLAARIGLINTMVFTHLPANLFLIIAGLAPNAPIAVAFILLRMLLSRMDVPARQSYVMRVVPPEERAAAASVTNVPRSLASALSPLLTGLMLESTTFGWPLICGGALKAIYDVLLLIQFRRVRPSDESLF